MSKLKATKEARHDRREEIGKTLAVVRDNFMNKRCLMCAEPTEGSMKVGFFSFPLCQHCLDCYEEMRQKEN